MVLSPALVHLDIDRGFIRLNVTAADQLSPHCRDHRDQQLADFEDPAVQRCAADIQADVSFQKHALPIQGRVIAILVDDRFDDNAVTRQALLDDIRSKIEAAQSAALPSSALSKACQYALALWKKLTCFLEYPELELSTNLAENSMRPVALGRKNWLHIGSPQAGPKVAAILSVVESCRRLQVPVRDYFSTILPGLADLPIRCLPDLTPAVWVARHS